MRHLELFAGIGGFRSAMNLIEHDGVHSFQHIGFSEIDAKATQSYKANYDTDGEVELGDIVKFTEDVERIKALPDFEIITGGFPCQSFSMMGKQLGFEDERGQLFFRIMDIVKVKKPTYLLLENVKNLRSHDNGETFKHIVNNLEEEGYNVRADIFNTHNFKLPQVRNRVLIFASRNPLPVDFVFSQESVKSYFDEHIDETSVAKYDSVIGLLEKHVADKYLLSERIKPTLLSDGSGGFKSKSEINQLVARPLTASMHKMHRACQDNYYSLDFIKSDGKTNPALTQSKDELSKQAIRKLTPKEAMLLQGFPADFAEKAAATGVADGALYKQAGNAVSVNTIYAVLLYLIKNKAIE